ncbi:MAG: pyridoxal phosphate-dependent aminotransferase [Erysipelotrichaceae bacterium]|nr:pyridoxal phosphate-dependent aminotransferase [Erysipelotrichaceae bacterium]
MSKYDFETRVDRRGTGSSKWNQMLGWNPNVSEGVVPLSVADMELKNAPEIIEGLKDFLDTAVLGYTAAYPAYIEAVRGWMKKHHNFDFADSELSVTGGVVAAFNSVVRAFTKPGDGVILMRPIYYPMGFAIANNGRKEVNVPLINKEGVYTIDFEKYEEACKDPNNKLLIFCSPHNPVGRVWTKEELKKIGDIALANDVLVLSDEIWLDFTYEDSKHTVFTTVDEAFKKNTIVCTAASKTFNLAGLKCSNIFVANPELKAIYDKQLMADNVSGSGILGYKGTELAYSKAEGWYEEMIELIKANRDYTYKFFADNYPKMKVTKLEGTYLIWVDMSCLGLDDKALEEFLHMEAEFFTDEGYVFGPEGSGYERINIACTKEILADAYAKLKKHLDPLYEKVK